MKKLVLLCVVVAVVAMTVALWQTNERITLQQAEQKVVQAYNGSLISSSAQNDAFSIAFTNASGEYEATVNTQGQLIALTQRTATTTSTPQLKPEPTPVQLSTEQATSIATARFGGTVEDTQFITSANGGYYVIEIEAGEQEITVQLHALTGDIMSVEYDD